jgi:hypothetical protein
MVSITSENNGNGLIGRMEFFEAMLDSGKFSSAALRVAFKLLFRHLNSQTGLCYPSKAILAQETKLSRATVTRAIGDLAHSDWWEVTGGHGAGRGHANSFRPNYKKAQHSEPFSDDSDDKKAQHNEPFSDDKKAQIGTEKGSRENASALENIDGFFDNQEEPEERERIPPIVPPRGPLSGFSEFWHIVPKRPGEPQEKARREFARASAAGAQLEAMLRGAAINKQYIDQHPEERPFIVSVARWLREKRWEGWQEPPAEPQRRLVGLF